MVQSSIKLLEVLIYHTVSIKYGFVREMVVKITSVSFSWKKVSFLFLFFVLVFDI